MKEFFEIIYKLYNWKIVLLFVILFLLLQLPFLHIIPDFFRLQEIETAQSFLLRLLTIKIGFSSFILTTF